MRELKIKEGERDRREGDKQAGFKKVSIAAAIYVAFIKTCQWWSIMSISWDSTEQYITLASSIIIGEGIFLEILGLIYFYRISKQRSKWKKTVFIILTSAVIASIFVMDNRKILGI